MTKGCLFWFCAEWQRARRVLAPDAKSWQELLAAVGPGGELDPQSAWVQQRGLAGWLCELGEAAEAGLLPCLGGRVR